MASEDKMSKGGRKHDEFAFYNQNTSSRALEVAEKSLMTQHRMKKGVWPSWAYWSDDDGRYIGIRGKIWTLLMLLRHENPESLSSRMIGDEISKIYIEDCKAKYDKTVFGKKYKFLRFLVSPFGKRAGESIIAADEEREFLLACSKYVLRQLSDHDRSGSWPEESERLRSDEVVRLLMTAKFESIGAAYRELIKRSWVGIFCMPGSGNGQSAREALFTSDSRHILPKTAGWKNLSEGNSLSTFGKDFPELLPSQTNEIISAIGNDKSVLFVQGNAHSGKSLAIMYFLNDLKNGKEKTLCYPLQHKDGSITRLPVFCIDTRIFEKEEIFVEVLYFLKRLKTTEARSEEVVREETRREVEGYIERRKINEIFFVIEALSRTNPALFIFDGWDELGQEGGKKIIPDSASKRLIDSLASSPDSRIIIITTKETVLDDLSVDFEVISVNDPSFQLIRWYLENHQDPLPFSECMMDIRNEWPDSTYYGGTLLALSIAIGLCKNEDKVPELSRYIIETARLNYSSFNEKENNKNSRALASNDIIKFIVEHLESMNMLEVVLAIAASHEGLRLSTIEKLLLDKNKFCLVDDDEKTCEIARIRLDKLEELHSIANGFFIRKFKAKPKTWYEYEIDETPVEEELVYEVDLFIAEKIFDFLSDDEKNGELSEGRYRKALRANRDIAILSRDVALTQKLVAHPVYEPFTIEFLKRDIHAYESLIASIDMRNPGFVQKDSHSRLYIKSANILSKAGFNDPVAALRFAVKCILREEIDSPNHWLTMKLDQDHVRLRLYLRLAFPTGKRIFLDLNKVRLPEHHGEYVLNPVMPEHMKVAFSLEEQMRWLKTIAITAHHCDRPDIVKWAFVLAENIYRAPDHSGDSDKSEEIRNQFSRILCYVMDCSVRHGYWIGSDLLKSGLKYGYDVIHEQICDYLSELFPMYERGAENFVARDSSESLDFRILVRDKKNRSNTRSWMRLKSRQIEAMLLMAGTNESLFLEAKDNYDMLLEVERLLPPSYEELGPLVFSGRSARKYLSFLLLLRQHEMKKSPLDKDELEGIDARLDSILSINKSRLMRSGLADQIAFYIDQGKIEYLRNNNFESASKLLSRAVELSQIESPSKGIKLEALIEEARLKIAIVKKELSRSKETADGFLEATNYLEHTRKLKQDFRLLIQMVAQAEKKNPLSQHIPTRGAAYLLIAKASYFHTKHIGHTGIKGFSPVANARLARREIAKIKDMNLLSELAELERDMGIEH